MKSHDKNYFLKEIRHRRNLFWLWLPVALLIQLAVISIIKISWGEPPAWIFTTLNAGSAIIGFILIIRVSKIRCPRCGNKALRFIPLTTMKYVCCQWCNYPENE